MNCLICNPGLLPESLDGTKFFMLLLGFITDNLEDPLLTVMVPFLTEALILLLSGEVTIESPPFVTDINCD
jgi:hypothetical protein